MTLAVMFAPPQPPAASLGLSKTLLDPQSCYAPGDEVTFRLTWENKGDAPVYDVVLTDYLADGMEYPQAGWELSFPSPPDPNGPPILITPKDPAYSEALHAWRYDIGTLDPNTSGFVDLSVMVGFKAEPGMPMRNQAALSSSVGSISAVCDVPVCCWDSGPIFVNPRANGSGIGTSWANAYPDLQRALTRAAASCGTEIWVAEGVYDPGRKADASFVIPSGVSLYGGFRGDETSRDQRNPKQYVTTLTGAAETARNETVVVMKNNTVLDGFTVTGAGPYPFGQGIYSSNADFAINNCNIIANEGYGLYSEDCNVDIKWCNFRSNKADGIRHIGENKTLILENVLVRQSGQYGMSCINSTPFIRNSIISESDLANEGREGIFMANPTYQPVVHGCTFAHNRSAAIFWADTHNVFGDPNYRDYPDIQNSIIYHNNSGGPQLAGFSADDCAWYSCIADANSVNFNTGLDPEFLYFSPENVRITPYSPARNSGNPYLDYSGQLDMDGNPRVYSSVPDMGAYELSCDANVSSDWDWVGADGLVNLAEFALFSRVWLAHDPNDPGIVDPNHPDHAYLTDPNSPGYVTPLGLAAWYPHGHTFNYVTTGASQYAIDFADLLYWTEEAPWLWTACWVNLSEPQQMMTGGEMLRMGSFETMTMPTVVAPEKTGLEQVAALANTIVHLENLWLEPDVQQEIDSAAWGNFMDALYQELIGLYLETQ
jgi:uncharacterized repeat protein (TIGR01451 family)